MDSFHPELETCPFCGSKSNCSIHSYYGRSLTDFIHGLPVHHDITILRVICSSCQHTHAILPDLIIPYSTYSLFFILRVLAEHFCGFRSIENICDRYSISVNQFYKWLKIWHSHKQDWLGLLSSLETSDRSFLLQLLRMSYSKFASSFTRSFSLSFLQSHHNPARYCQQVFDP